MQLVINTLGTHISVSGECFRLKCGDKKQELSSKKENKF